MYSQHTGSELLDSSTLHVHNNNNNNNNNNYSLRIIVVGAVGGKDAESGQKY